MLTPEPEEPTGLGALATDAKGVKYVRVSVPFDGFMKGREWRRIGGSINGTREYGWPDLPRPVTVLTAGYEGES